MSARAWKDMLVGAQEGDLERVKQHLEQGIDPNYQHPELLTTPLIESISYEHASLVEYLLAHGANPQLKAGFSEDSPLRVAKQTGNQEIIKLLQQHLPTPSLRRRLWEAAGMLLPRWLKVR